MSELFAGVDVATANVRVQIHDRRGQVQAAATRALPEPVRDECGASEQDATAWWPAVRACLRECCEALGNRSAAVAALSVSATSGTVVLVDESGAPSGPAVMYDDRRGVREAGIAAEVGRERWRHSGIVPSAGSGLAHIALLVRRSPEPAARVCHTPDVIARQLTGAAVPTDTSHALKSGYDVIRGEWASEVFDALGVSERLLPEVVRPTTPLGAVSARAAEQTGLPVGCLVRAGMTDGCAGQLACGAVGTGAFVTVLGTTFVLKGVSELPVSDPTGAVYSHLHPDGLWLPGGAANLGGSALADLDPGSLSERDEAAQRRGPAGVVSYPLRGKGERFPFRASEATAFTLGEPADAVEDYRARLEGVAFAERLALSRLEQLGAPAAGIVRTAGGGATSRVWCRIRASVLNRPVMRMRQASTALGAAVLAAAGSAHADLSGAAAAMVGAGEVVEPAPEEVQRLDENYRSFTAELRRRGWL